MPRSTRTDSWLAPTNSARFMRTAAASLGLCAMMYCGPASAQGAPPAAPGGAPSTMAPPPPPPPPSATTAGPAAPTQAPPTATPGQPPSPPPQGYGYPQPYPYPYPQAPYGGAPSPYAPPPYYGAPYYYEQPPPPPPPTRRNNATMMGAGVAMVVVGGIGFLSSLAVLASANNRIDVYCDGGFQCSQRDDTSLQLAGGVLMVVTGAVLVAGIPLWVIGGRKVPVEAPPAPETSPKYGLFEPTAPVLSVGPASASLSFAF